MRARYRILVVGIVAAALVGCDPYPVPSEPDHAELYVEFNASGGASVMLMLGGHVLTSPQLLAAGQKIAPELFDHHGQQAVRIDNQKTLSGYPFIRISAANVYAAGPKTVVHIDTEAALSLLGGMGYRSVLVDVSAREGADTAVWRDPPDATATDDWTWNAVVPGQAAPAGDITIVPSPTSHAASRDFAQAGEIAGSLVVVAALGFLMTALVSRRQRKRSTPPSPQEGSGPR